MLPSIRARLGSFSPISAHAETHGQGQVSGGLCKHHPSFASISITLVTSSFLSLVLTPTPLPAHFDAPLYLPTPASQSVAMLAQALALLPLVPLLARAQYTATYAFGNLPSSSEQVSSVTTTAEVVAARPATARM